MNHHRIPVDSATADVWLEDTGKTIVEMDASDYQSNYDGVLRMVARVVGIARYLAPMLAMEVPTLTTLQQAGAPVTTKAGVVHITNGRVQICATLSSPQQNALISPEQ